MGGKGSGGWQLQQQQPSDRHQKVINAVRGGATLREAGEQIGVCRERARQICRRWGVTERANGLPPAELKTATSLYERGMPINHIACALKVGGDKVARALIRRGMHAREAQGPRPMWSKADVAALRRGRKRDKDGRPAKSFRVLAEKLGKTQGAVCGKARRMGLCILGGDGSSPIARVNRYTQQQSGSP
jgi:hypothetical protein